MLKRLGNFSLPPGYDFGGTLTLSPFSTTIGIVSDGAFWRVLRQGDSLALVRLRETAPKSGEVVIELMALRGELDEARLFDQAVRLLGTSFDAGAFFDYARGQAALWPVVAPLEGVHLLQAGSVYEGMVLTIIEQQISLKTAQTAERWLLAWGGDSLSYGEQTFYAFPRPEKIAAATVEDLTPLKITFQRMERIIALAQLEVADSFERLHALPTEDAMKTLLAFKGVGPWTAAWVCLRALGRFAYFTSADVALRSAVHHYFFGQPGRASTEVTDTLFRAFNDHAGAAAFYTLGRWAIERE